MATYPTHIQQQEIQSTQDQLRYISIAAYIYAALNTVVLLVVGCFFLFGFGIMAVQPPPEAAAEMRGFQFLLVSVIVVAVVFSLASLAAQFIFARLMQVRRRHTVCVVLAGLTCMNMPLGTALGVWALVILMKPESRQLFET